MRVREGGCGADFYVVEARHAGWGDGVEPWEGREIVERVGANVREGGVGRDGCVTDQGGVVGAVQELGEEGRFVGGKVEASEVVQFRGDGDEEFLGDDQFRAGGCFDKDFDAVVAASVRRDDVALQQDVVSEFCERLHVYFAVVLAGGGQETDLQILQDAEAEVFENVQSVLF